MTEQGNRWLLTRPDPMNGVLSRELTALGDVAWIHPLLCIEPLAEAALRLTEEPVPWEHVIFTSQPAVEHSSALLPRLIGNHGLASTCYAVGDATRSKLAEYGIKARSGNEPGSESLLRAMLPLPPRQSVLLVTGEGGRTLIEDTLRAANHSVTPRRDMRTHILLHGVASTARTRPPAPPALPIRPQASSAFSKDPSGSR